MGEKYLKKNKMAIASRQLHRQNLVETPQGQLFFKIHIRIPVRTYKRIRHFLKGKHISTHDFFLMAARRLIDENLSYK